MFQCLIRVIDGLQLYPARMMANLNKTRGLIFSSKVLLALVDTGITREDAYAIVQENAMAPGTKCRIVFPVPPLRSVSRPIRAAPSARRSSTRSLIRGTSSPASTRSSIAWSR